MDLTSATHLIIEYRYWILVPLSIVEGPIVAFAAGSLASLGYFNIFVLGIFFFARDMIMDGIYYSIGYYGGRTRWAQHAMHKVGIKTDHLDEIRALWEKRAGRTMLTGKIAYGIATGFIILAGTIRMPLKKFFGWGALVAMGQFWSLLALGYFFGTSLSPSSTHLVENILSIIAFTGLFAAAYYVVGLYFRKRWNKATH